MFSDKSLSAKEVHSASPRELIRWFVFLFRASQAYPLILCLPVAFAVAILGWGSFRILSFILYVILVTCWVENSVYRGFQY